MKVGNQNLSQQHLLNKQKRKTVISFVSKFISKACQFVFQRKINREFVILLSFLRFQFINCLKKCKSVQYALATKNFSFFLLCYLDNYISLWCVILSGMKLHFQSYFISFIFMQLVFFYLMHFVRHVPKHEVIQIHVQLSRIFSPFVFLFLFLLSIYFFPSYIIGVFFFVIRNNVSDRNLNICCLGFICFFPESYPNTSFHQLNDVRFFLRRYYSKFSALCSYI